MGGQDGGEHGGEHRDIVPLGVPLDKQFRSLRSPIIPLALFAGTILLFVLSFRAYFHGGESFEFCHYAEIASNILDGRGFATRFFYPSSLAYLREAGKVIDPLGPVFERFPLYSGWCALWMAVGGRGDFGMALANGVAHALAVALIWILGRRLFSPRAALAAAVLWAFNPVLLGGFDLWGYADVLFVPVFGALAAFYLAALRDPTADTKRFALLGLAAGGAFLCRYSFLAWLPLFAAAPFVARRRSAAREAAAFVGAFAAIWLPWVAFETWQIGRYSPAFGLWNAAEGTLIPKLPWMEYRTYSLRDFLVPSMPLVFLRKASFLFDNFSRDIPTLWALTFLFPFAAAGMLTASGAEAALSAWVGALFLWQWLVMSFLRYESLGGFMGGRYYLWFGPFVVLFAVEFIEKRAAASSAWRMARWVVLLLVCQLWMMAFIYIPRQSDHATHRPVGLWPEIAYVRSSTPVSAWIMTNMPTQISWYTGRRTVNIPNDPQVAVRMLREWPIDYLLISKHRIAELFNYPEWQRLLNTSAEFRQRSMDALGFEVDQAFEEAILLRRKK
jgi:hypothetical protein